MISWCLSLYEVQAGFCREINSKGALLFRCTTQNLSVLEPLSSCQPASEEPDWNLQNQNNRLILTCDQCFSLQSKNPSSCMNCAKVEGGHAKDPQHLGSSSMTCLFRSGSVSYHLPRKQVGMFVSWRDKREQYYLPWSQRFCFPLLNSVPQSLL